MTDPNFSAIRARLRYESLDDFIDGYSRFISTGGMFIPMAPSKLKPVGTTIRFQFLLQDGATAMLGEGVVRQIQGADRDDNSPVGMLVKFTKLSRESKEVVERAVARKSDDASTLAPDSEELQAPTPEAHTPAPSEPEDDIFASEDQEVPEADDARTRDAEDGDTGVLAPEENDALNDMFLSPDDKDAEDVFEQPEDSSPAAAFEQPEDEADEAPPVGVAASGSDVFSEAELDSEPTDDDSVSSGKPAEGPGPKELGRTEAGLQIMAFDDVSDDEMADFGNFDFGGDEDEVDQMFDGIFGGGGGDDDGGGLFGGGDDDGGDFFGGGDDDGADFFGDGDEALMADSANDGGTPLDTDSDAIDEPDEAASQTYDLEEEVDETYDLDEEFELDDDSAHEVLAEESGAEVEQTFDLDEEIDLDEDEFELDEDEIEFDEDEIELDEESDFDEEIDLDEVSGPVQAGAFERPGTQKVEDADVLSEEDADEHIDPARADGFGRHGTQKVQDADVLSEEDADADGAISTGLAQESSAPSEDLMSALGSLDSDGEDEELALSLGAGAANEEEEEAAPEEFEDDDEESLESLLALAQQDIDAKRETEEDEEDQGDILDDLLGSDDLPPPPGNEPVFDLGDGEKKKKKGGFISKLFGKD